MRKLKRLLYIFITVIILLSLLALFMATTNSGLRFALIVAKHFIPGQLTVETLEGRAIEGIDATGIHYQDQQQSVTIVHLHLRGNLLALLRHHLNAKQLTIDDIDYKTVKKSAKKEETSQPTTQASQPHKRARFTLTIQQLTINQLRIIHNKHTTTINQITGQLYLSGSQLQFNQLTVQKQNLQTKIHGNIALTAPFKTQLALTASGYLDSGQPIDGQLTLHGDSQQMILHGTMKQPFISQWQGSADNWLEDNGAINLVGQWQKLIWIVNRKTSIVSQQGQLKIQGNLQNYHLTFDSDLTGSRLPEGKWHINADGNRKQLNFSTIAIQTLKGKLSATGKVSWLPYLQWDFQAHGSHLQPGVKWPQWKSNISFDTTVNGEYDRRLDQLHWQVTNLTGEWLKQPLSGAWNIEVAPKHITVQQGKLAVGKNHLMINGQLNQTWQLNWQIDIPNLATLYPTATGQINSSGQIGGNRTHPRIQTKTTIHSLSLPTMSLQSLQASSNILWQPQGDINLSLQINKLQTLKQTINQLNILSQGTLNQQQWQLNIDSHLLKAKAQAAGHFDLTKQTWQGEINTLQMHGVGKTEWQLNKATALSLGRRQLALSPFCLTSNKQGQLCGHIDWQSNRQIDMLINATKFNLRMLNPLMPQDFRINGPINGNLKISKTVQQRYVQGEMTITIPQLRLNRPLLVTNPPPMRLDNIQLKALLNNQGLALNLTTAGSNQIKAAIQLPNYHLIDSTLITQKLQGQINAQITDLQSLPIFIPALQNSHGKIQGKLNVNGPFGSPQLLGEIKLINGSTSIPTISMALKDVNLTTDWQRDHKIAVKGSLHSNQGSLEITGTSHWLPPFISQIHLNAKQLQVMDSEEYQVIADGPVTINYDMPIVSIKGNLTIPKAKLTPKTFSGVETLPENITYVSEETQTSRLNLDLSLNLKQIILQYKGLSAQLEGALTLRKTPQTLLTATGELKTTQGHYKAYGQELTIDRGNLYYAGGPIANPGINIRAVRVIQELSNFGNYNTDMPRLVGLRMIGTLRNPKVSLFAEPDNFSQSNILSYLLLGKGISSASSTQGQELLVAASSLGLAQTGLLQSIQKTFGFSEIGFESGQIYDSDSKAVESNTSFVLGKQITPRLTVKYSIGLLLPVNIFEVIYRLSEHWHIQTDSSSLDDGADIIYTIESG